MNSPWFELLRKYWPNAYWVKSDDDVVIVSGELKQKFGDKMPDNDELCDVVRWMSGPECDLSNRAPSLRQLIMFIYTRRKGGTGGGESEQVIGCDLCKTAGKEPKWGWLYPQTDLHARHFIGVPCVCIAGDDVMSKAKQYKDMEGERRERIEVLRNKAANAVAEGGVIPHHECGYKYYSEDRQPHPGAAMFDDNAQNGLDVVERATG